MIRAATDRGLEMRHRWCRAVFASLAAVAFLFPLGGAVEGSGSTWPLPTEPREEDEKSPAEEGTWAVVSKAWSRSLDRRVGLSPRQMFVRRWGSLEDSRRVLELFADLPNQIRNGMGVPLRC